jgi:hypothetical protein
MKVVNFGSIHRGSGKRTLVEMLPLSTGVMIETPAQHRPEQ